MAGPIDTVNAAFPLPGPFPQFPSVEDGQVEIPNMSPGITIPDSPTDPDISVPTPGSVSEDVEDAVPGNVPVQAILGVGAVLAVAVALGQLFNINVG